MPLTAEDSAVFKKIVRYREPVEGTVDIMAAEFDVQNLVVVPGLPVLRARVDIVPNM